MGERIVGYRVECRDKAGPEPAETRQTHMQAHLDHMARHKDKFWLAGPLFDGDQIVGSMLIVKANSAEEAIEIVKQDPYASQDIWAEVSAERFVAAAGDWVGGVTW